MLKQSVPSTGLICVASIRNPKFPPKHFFFDTYDEAHAFAIEEDTDGNTVYMGQSSYLTRENRKATNAVAVRAFWMDIDCGEGKPYADYVAGAAALKKFLEESKLQTPSVVLSGGGLYAYWCMDADMRPKQFANIGRYLKKICAAYGFEIDPSRTSDAASVLRPIGSTNRKLEGNPRPVRLVKDMPQIPLPEFVTALAKAGRGKGLKPDAVKTERKSNDPRHADTSVPSDADKMADACGQMWAVRDSKGNVDEPLWYAAIGLLRYTDDNELIHEWSNGHPQYSHSATEAKIQQHEEADVGPTTCEHFSSVNPKGCIGCHQNVKSPIVLGRPDPEPVNMSLLSRLGGSSPPLPEAETGVAVEPTPTLTTEQLISPAEGFTLSEDGLWFKSGDVNLRFYDRLLYPVRVAYDEGLGYETLTLRHHSSHDGVNDFNIRTAIIHDMRALMQALTDNHVLVTGKEEKTIMNVFLESYAQKLQRASRMVRLMSQMGWKDLSDGPAFVLGKRIFHADGSIDEASLASNVPAAAEAFEAVGDSQLWINSTEVLGKPDMEPYAFAMMAGAFGAPALKFTGFEGAMISLVGPTGAGKTMVTRWAQSAYGDHNRLMMLRDDTKNSLISRLGLYGSLPLTIDEITNIDPAELSDLVYRVTQGRDKARLNRNAVERSNVNHWNTIALVSTNMPLVDKLSGHKADASAEINRVFEYTVEPNPFFGREVATGVFRTISDNYGGIGQEYIKYLVQNTEKHQANIDAIASIIDERAGLSSDERYWSAVVACTIYGGSIASKLGLIKFDVDPVMAWAIEQLRRVKVVKQDVVSNAPDTLAAFFDEHTNNRIVVQCDNQKNAIALLEPRSQLMVRVERGSRYVLISRSSLRTWCTRKNISYTAMRSELASRGVLLDANIRRNLGAGTNYSGASQPCWRIDIQSPAMGGIGVAIQYEVEELGRLKGVK